MHLIKKLILVLLVCLPMKSWSANLHYALDVKINLKEHKITGSARLKSDTDNSVVLSVRNLGKLKVDGNAKFTAADESIHLTLLKGKATQITYEALFSNAKANFIDKDNILLNDHWYPQPDLLAEYSLSVALPKNFMAISEAEAIKIQHHGETKTINFQFEHPLDSLHLVASTRYVLKKDKHNHMAIETYFFKKEAQLSDKYIGYVKEYLNLYETILTQFPYQRFAIVENIFSTADSMPTYALLDNRLIKLPLTGKTSLGHAILHQWFGNSVYVDFVHGNWAEGIIDYLAEHNPVVLPDDSIAYRKRIMMDYGAYMNKNNAMPVSDFRSRSHKAQNAAGRGKAVMLFHGLRKRFGDKIFFAALREFIQQNRFRKASWHDIQRAFEKVTGEKLYAYFTPWLTRKDIPQLRVEDVQLQMEQGQLKLKFTLLQTGEAYRLLIPISLYTESSKSQRFVEVKDAKANISLTLDELPTKVVIDENYELMRQLDPDELPPVLASVMGKKKLIAVVSARQRNAYRPLMEALGVKDITYVATEDITFKQMQEGSFIIAGYDNLLADMLFGKQTVPEDGVRLKVYKNPYHPAERIVLLHAKNKAEAQALQRNLSGYGKYTELAFSGGKNTHIAIAESNNGISVMIRPATRVLKPAQLAAFNDILPKLKNSRIIYVGEKHDRFAHHLNQLEVIKKLHEAGYKLAVGMEMFQIPYQKTIDDYLAGRIDEGTFLKKSEYFKKWGYDYNLYKPIIDYLKQQNIPLIALNIQGDITRKVARKGMHSLKDKEKKQLPATMDFSNQQYRDDLKQVFSLHGNQQDIVEFNYFLQAQTLWDESMAESAQQFLKAHPAYTLVILAGNGHVRYKYGIPERLYRRNHEPFTVIVQDEEILDGVADYVLLTTKLKGKASPKLGVSVEEKDQNLVVRGVSDKSPAMKAGLLKGDIIKQFAGQPIESLADLKLALFYSQRGSTVSVRVERDGKLLDKEVELLNFRQFSQNLTGHKRGGR
jgi:uncharacterized iron-regulated protein